MRLPVLLLICSLTWAGLPAQQISYKFYPKVDYPVLLGSTLLSLGGNWLKVTTPVLTESQVEFYLLHPPPRFDRIAIDLRSSTASEASDYTGYLAWGLMLSTYAFKGVRKEWKIHTVMLWESLMVTETFTSLTKSLIRRPRPYVYQPDRPVESKQRPNDRHSFISGHTSSSAAAGFYFAQIFHDHFPDSKWRIPVWILGAGVPAVTGFLRVRAGKHFPSDVIAGYLVGGLVGMAVPRLHSWENRSGLSLQVGLSGLSLTF
ncbi:MAG: phosphatase PAP2 family protein [Bacteroidota bacterium]